MNKFLLILALLIPSLADAATLYVRAGATGNGSGSDWLNAFSSLPTFQRGNTYWIADGSYGGLSLSAAESGSTWSYVKKATVAAHGTETGWSNAYGDGRATFGGDVTFHTGYWEVDGATRNEADWSQASAYGFKIGYSNIITLVAGVDRITVKYVEVDSARNQVAVLQSYQEGLWREYLTFSHMLFTEPGMAFHSRNCSYVTIDHCYFTSGFSKEVISHEYGGNWTIYNCYFIDSASGRGDNGMTAILGFFNFNGGGSDPADNDVPNGKIYGCVFAQSASPPLEQWLNDAGPVQIVATGWVFHNNTIYNPADAGPAGYVHVTGSGNTSYNNLFYNVRNASIGPNITINDVWAYSAIDDSYTNFVGTTGFVQGSENPFVNAAALDFRLKDTFSGNSPKNQGTALAAEYNTDILGNVRGADGSWDIGAFEYVAAGTNAPVINSALTAIATNSVAFSYTLTASNSATSYGFSSYPSGLTVSSAALSGTPSDTAGTFNVGLAVTNSYGYDTDTLVVTLYNGLPPTLTTSPTAQTNSAATGVSLTALATSTYGTPRYQWQMASTNLPNATNASYSKIPAATTDSGLYLVIASNNFGAITSSAVWVSLTNSTAVPTITVTNYTGNINVALSTWFSATENPTAYAVSNLPTGLSVYSNNIVGTPTVAQTNVITVYATNASGFASNQATYRIQSQVGTNISVGSRVSVNITPDLRVRDAAAVAGNVLGVQSYEAEGTVTGGPTTADGYTWWEVNYDASPDGWSIEGANGVYWLIVAPPDGDTTAPSVTITTPATSPLYTSTRYVTISGTASDDIAVGLVSWVGSWGGTDNATGTTNWTASATLPSTTGNYTVSVIATDTSSNTATNSTVFRYDGSTATISTVNAGNVYIGQ